MSKFCIGGVKDLNLKTYKSEKALLQEIIKTDSDVNDNRNYYVYIADGNGKLQKINKDYVNEIIHNNPSILLNDSNILVCVYNDAELTNLYSMMNYISGDILVFDGIHDYECYDLNKQYIKTYHQGESLVLTEDIIIYRGPQSSSTTTLKPTASPTPNIPYINVHNYYYYYTMNFGSLNNITLSPKNSYVKVYALEEDIVGLSGTLPISINENNNCYFSTTIDKTGKIDSINYQRDTSGNIILDPININICTSTPTVPPTSTPTADYLRLTNIYDYESGYVTFGTSNVYIPINNGSPITVLPRKSDITSKEGNLSLSSVKYLLWDGNMTHQLSNPYSIKYYNYGATLDPNYISLLSITTTKAPTYQYYYTCPTLGYTSEYYSNYSTCYTDALTYANEHSCNVNLYKDLEIENHLTPKPTCTPGPTITPTVTVTPSTVTKCVLNITNGLPIDSKLYGEVFFNEESSVTILPATTNLSLYWDSSNKSLYHTYGDYIYTFVSDTDILNIKTNNIHNEYIYCLDDIVSRAKKISYLNYTNFGGTISPDNIFLSCTLAPGMLESEDNAGKYYYYYQYYDPETSKTISFTSKYYDTYDEAFYDYINNDNIPSTALCYIYMVGDTYLNTHCYYINYKNLTSTTTTTISPTVTPTSTPTASPYSNIIGLGIYNNSNILNSLLLGNNARCSVGPLSSVTLMPSINDLTELDSYLQLSSDNTPFYYKDEYSYNIDIYFQNYGQYATPNNIYMEFPSPSPTPTTSESASSTDTIESNIILDPSGDYRAYAFEYADEYLEYNGTCLVNTTALISEDLAKTAIISETGFDKTKYYKIILTDSGTIDGVLYEKIEYDTIYWDPTLQQLVTTDPKS